MDNNKLNDKQQKLIVDNYQLLCDYIKKVRRKVPKYLEDDFISDMFLKFCVSALRFNKHSGFKFSTYAYGGFGLGIKELFERKNKKVQKLHYSEDLEKYKLEYKEVTHVEVSRLDDFIDKVVLNDRDKSMLKDYFYNRISYPQLGIKYGMSGEGVRLKVINAIKKMQKCVKRNDYEYEDFVEEVVEY